MRIRSIIEQIQRFFYWGWKLRKSYDFDAGTIYTMLYLKLDRLHKNMLVDPYCMWTDDPNGNLMRKLAEAKELAKRLSDEKFDQYNPNYSKLIDSYVKESRDRWELELFSNRPQNVKKIPNKLYKVYFKKAMEKDNNLWKGDRVRLFYLLDKYIDIWWT